MRRGMIFSPGKIWIALSSNLLYFFDRVYFRLHRRNRLSFPRRPRERLPNRRFPSRREAPGHRRPRRGSRFPRTDGYILGHPAAAAAAVAAVVSVAPSSDVVGVVDEKTGETDERRDWSGIKRKTRKKQTGTLLKRVFSD